jgi:hypothetical protein
MPNIKIRRHNSSSSSLNYQEIQSLVGKSEIQLSNNWIFDRSSRFQTFLMVQYIKMSLVLSFLVLFANGVHFWLTSLSYAKKANIRLPYCVHVSLSIPFFQLWRSVNGLHKIWYKCYAIRDLKTIIFNFLQCSRCIKLWAALQLNIGTWSNEW